MPTSYQTADYLALPRAEIPFIVDDLLPAGGSMLIYGDPKIGKSFAALQLARDIASGQPWFGFPTHPTPVLYVQLDTPRGLWMARMDQLEATGEQLAAPPIYQMDRESMGTWPFNIQNPDHAAILRAEVDLRQAGVVIIDTLKESHQAAENDNTEGQRIISALSSATQPAALIIIHHSRKPSDGRPNDLINGARGANYLTGRMDTIISFSPRTMHYTGRATEGGSIKLDRKDNGFWELKDEPAQVQDWVNHVMSQPDLSMRERARMLAEATGRSEEACRSMLRRHTSSTI